MHGEGYVGEGLPLGVVEQSLLVELDLVSLGYLATPCSYGVYYYRHDVPLHSVLLLVFETNTHVAALVH